MRPTIRFFSFMALAMVSIFGGSACSDSASQGALKDDVLLTKFAQWHVGFTTNAAQRDEDLAAETTPRWGLSELRFQRIWHDRDDGYWLYYETSQPDVRPDRNQIWRLYRNDVGDLKVDAYNFKDIKAGLSFWGKGADPALFASIKMEELATTEGCNATYTWRPEFQRFVGGNVQEACTTIGDSYLHQHVELSNSADGTLARKDWHTFYDGNGVAKLGQAFKQGTHGPTVHLYVERYQLD